MDQRDGGEELLAKMEPTLIEAAEQCERLSIPRLLPPLPLAQLLREQEQEAAGAGSLLYVCRERGGDGSGTTKPLLAALDADAATLLEPGASKGSVVGG